MSAAPEPITNDAAVPIIDKLRTMSLPQVEHREQHREDQVAEITAIVATKLAEARAQTNASPLSRQHWTSSTPA